MCSKFLFVFKLQARVDEVCINSSRTNSAVKLYIVMFVQIIKMKK